MNDNIRLLCLVTCVCFNVLHVLKCRVGSTEVCHLCAVCSEICCSVVSNEMCYVD